MDLFYDFPGILLWRDSTEVAWDVKNALNEGCD
jgi:hypothetical protein